MVFGDSISVVGDGIREIGDSIDHWDEGCVDRDLIERFIVLLGYSDKNIVRGFDTGRAHDTLIDYALLGDDGELNILVHCRPLLLSSTLELSRLFPATSARFAIITDGQTYNFYSDTNKENTLDLNRFFSFSVQQFTSLQLGHLMGFTRFNFNVDKLIRLADRLKNIELIEILVKHESKCPPNSLFQLFTAKVFSHVIARSIENEFKVLDGR